MNLLWKNRRSNVSVISNHHQDFRNDDMKYLMIPPRYHHFQSPDDGLLKPKRYSRNSMNHFEYQIFKNNNDRQIC